MIYTIKQGKHYSTHYAGMLWRLITGWTRKNKLKANVKFSPECLAPSQDAEDLNKLFGLSFGWDHHQDSVRFGWVAGKTKIKLYAYSYHSGKRLKPQFIGFVRPGEWAKLEMFRTLYDGYILIVQTEDTFRYVEVKQEFPQPLLSYRLWPYFGGSFPAPKTMKVKINWL